MCPVEAKGSMGKGCVVIDEEKCKACGLCVYFCPQENLGFCESINARGFHPAGMLEEDKCTACGNCALMCPEVCIKVYRRKQG
jgi:2-oxoglutarate ferredoxin oxidoreductase subunit delta